MIIEVGWDNCIKLLAGVDAIYYQETEETWKITFYNNMAHIFCEVLKTGDPAKDFNFVDTYLARPNVYRVLKIHYEMPKIKIITENDLE